MTSMYSTLLKITLLSIICLFYSLDVNAVDIELNKSSFATIPVKVEIEDADDSTKNLNIKISNYSIVKSKLNHQFVGNVKPWSALNNNVVCNIVLEFTIPKAETDRKQKVIPFCETTAALLKLNHGSIIDIKNHRLFYYQNEEWINCYELKTIDFTDGYVNVKVQIPILNSELEKLNRLNTISIDKVRVLFNDNEKYIDWEIGEDSRVYLYKKLKEIASIDSKEMERKSIRDKTRQGF